ncbi:hypothetical protein X777_12487 [Ooceraea biroi]|uniref:Uncharacterized protein n=1 Tax=Ooceraea biroi TaxID=2015173 RepID=A0A026VZQ5_OOCBI|nr:hypothetical protein X777_12487 [Ooceraea biroi]
MNHNRYITVIIFRRTNKVF